LSAILTFQDFLKATNRAKWIGSAIGNYMRSEPYRIALDADEYEAQRNITILNTVKLVYDITGAAAVDPTAANNRIASNFFHHLCKDRVQYSLGNGLSFPEEDGATDIKAILGPTFDTDITDAAKLAVRHGVSYIFVNDDRLDVFPMTQFLPLYDEETGAMRAGIRFWSLEWRKRPIQAVLFEEDGYTKYATESGKYGLGALQLQEEKRAYKQTVQYSEADGEEVIAQSNYGELPIVPVFPNDTKQSALVGLRAKIDAYDMIQSGFANDLQDCAQMYWIIGNAMGMDDDAVAKLRDRLLFQHMAVVDTTNSSLTPYTQEIPYSARQACLDQLRAAMYEDFGVLDVHTVAAGATNDHIDAGYQPMDSEADDFEYQIITAVQQILRIKGIKPVVPTFKRNRISNQMEQTQMVIMAAQYLDRKTVVKKLPMVTVDEVDDILQAKYSEDTEKFRLSRKEEEDALNV